MAERHDVHPLVHFELTGKKVRAVIRFHGQPDHPRARPIGHEGKAANPICTAVGELYGVILWGVYLHLGEEDRVSGDGRGGEDPGRARGDGAVEAVAETLDRQKGEKKEEQP